ncbi:MAG: hypothetical protein WAZ12_03965 [Candidatus Absconditicoccaceae bacterium]
MKRFLIITSIISSLLIFGCNKTPQIIDTTDTGEVLEKNIDNTTGDTIGLTGTEQNNLTGATSGDIQIFIDEYKTKETGNSDKLNENDIDLMEKVIEEIEKK